MKLYLLRHGQTDHNLNGIVQGWSDTILNQNGHNQARTAANDFDYSIDAIVSSDLARAQQTAGYFKAKFSDLPYFVDWRLRERSFGQAENIHKDEHDWEIFWASYESVSIPGAESLADYDSRVKSFLQDCKNLFASKYSSILIVTHGGTINRVGSILKPEEYHYTQFSNTDIIEFEI